MPIESPLTGLAILTPAKLDNTPLHKSPEDLGHELARGRIDDKLLEKLIERYEADPKAKINRPIRKIFGFGRSKSAKLGSPPQLQEIQNKPEAAVAEIGLAQEERK